MAVEEVDAVVKGLAEVGKANAKAGWFIAKCVAKLAAAVVKTAAKGVIRD
jgi:hypothetical protein